MTDDVSKLPAWPEVGDFHGIASPFDSYHKALADYYEARMEALMEYVQHTGAWCGQNMGHACTCGLSALLAACKRSESP